MFVTNWNSTTKIQKISEITNFFRHYFLSRTEVIIHKKEDFCLVDSIFYSIFAVETKNDDYEVKGILYCTDFISCRRA